MIDIGWEDAIIMKRGMGGVKYDKVLSSRAMHKGKSSREDDLGEFQFGTFHGDIDYRIESYQDTERLEFSWEGEDDMDLVSGQGWAIFADGQLLGKTLLS